MYWSLRDEGCQVADHCFGLTYDGERFVDGGGRVRCPKAQRLLTLEAHRVDGEDALCAGDPEPLDGGCPDSADSDDGSVLTGTRLGARRRGSASATDWPGHGRSAEFGRVDQHEREGGRVFVDDYKPRYEIQDETTFIKNPWHTRENR